MAFSFRFSGATQATHRTRNRPFFLSKWPCPAGVRFPQTKQVPAYLVLMTPQPLHPATGSVKKFFFLDRKRVPSLSALVARIVSELKHLIRESEIPLSRIARRAGLEGKPEYLKLWRWVNGKAAEYDVQKAEDVYKALTGKTFTRK